MPEHVRIVISDENDRDYIAFHGKTGAITETQDDHDLHLVVLDEPLSQYANSPYAGTKAIWMTGDQLEDIDNS